ncbi:MAG: T9SS type A sorting domain-containing protein, partial [Candidatus Marinimicrobia bacterium]|nr:T9SS type A sorting domain-containing protein [Candidatus Neomarinimicrobiota bacterium]
DYWGYGHTVVGDEGWIPTWPLPEMVALDWGDYTAVENEPLPERFTLEQNFPNPFNPITEITFTLNQESDITLTIFNMLGQEVKELTSGFKPVGKYTVQWNGKDNLGRSVSTGVYLYSLNNGTQVLTKKMVLMK